MKRKPCHPKVPVPAKREARKWTLITQQRIASHFGVSREYVNRVTTGAYHNPAFRQRIQTLVHAWLGSGKHASAKLLKNLFGGNQ